MKLYEQLYNTQNKRNIVQGKAVTVTMSIFGARKNVLLGMYNV